MKCNNLPINYTDYPYIVANRIDGILWYWGAFKKRNDANECALEIGGETWESANIEHGWC